MPNRISVTIAGQQYTILAEESEEYTQQVAKRADHKIAEAKAVTDASMLNAAVLAALNLADEATKAERDVERTSGELSEREEQAETGFNETEIDGMKGFVFITRFGSVPNPQSVNRTIKRITSNYNAEETVNAKKERREPVILPDFSCHHLRHTFCTRLCENETNLKVIQAVMGHRNIETTMDIYAEATDRKKQESFDRLSKLDIF